MQTQAKRKEESVRRESQNQPEEKTDWAQIQIGVITPDWGGNRERDWSQIAIINRDQSGNREPDWTNRA